MVIMIHLNDGDDTSDQSAREVFAVGQAAGVHTWYCDNWIAAIFFLEAAVTAYVSCVEYLDQ